MSILSHAGGRWFPRVGSACARGRVRITALGRERLFEYFSVKHARRHTPTSELRIEMRYGSCSTSARRFSEKRPLNLAMAPVNVICRGTPTLVCLRASVSPLRRPPSSTSPARNPFVRGIAQRFGEVFVSNCPGRSERETALMSNAAACITCSATRRSAWEQMIEWVAEWIRQGGPLLGKPTHFDVRDGKF